MEYLISYVIQGIEQARYMSEVVDLNLVAPLYSPDPPESDVEREVVHWIKQKQQELRNGESVVVIKFMRV